MRCIIGNGTGPVVEAREHGIEDGPVLNLPRLLLGS